MTATLKTYLVVAVVGAAFGGLVGSLATSVVKQGRIDSETVLRETAEKTLLEVRVSLAEKNASALTQIVQQQQEQMKNNAAISDRFNQTLSALSQATRRIENSIPAAIAADGDGWNGIGDSGLRLYREALGYGQFSGNSLNVSTPATGTVIPATPTTAPSVGHAAGTAATRSPFRGMDADTGGKTSGIQGMGSTAKAEP